MAHFKSKRGIALPVAIVITTVLVILASSLLFIALNTLSNTSSDVDTRQAYINAKSALDYAAAYYNSGASLPGDGVTDGATEYVVMNDTYDGTSEEGATIYSSASAADDAKTYVTAVYKAKETASDNPQLVLTAYAASSDTFGQKAKVIKLTVTYSISGSNETTRVTSIVAKNSTDSSVSTTTDYITLNVKTNSDYSFVPYFYTWTYYDYDYDSTTLEATYYKDSETSLGETASVFSSYSNVSKVEQSSNMLTPNGIWNSDSDNDGPQGQSTQTSGTTDWYKCVYNIADDTVNYFNAIIARKGSMLTQNTTGSVSNIQTCEMFHLWYADPNDKQVYFEILDEDFYYYYGTGWNGTDNLEDYILVYTPRQATVVHFKLTNDRTSSDGAVNDDSYSLSLSAAGVSVGSTQYEGYGWYVALVETSDSFDATITVGSSGTSYTVSVTPSSDKEAYIVVDVGNSTAVSRTTESTANIYMNIDDDSYVTVSAKAYKGTSSTSPTLYYVTDSATSSTAKRALLSKILEAQDYDSSDYTEDSFDDLTDAINNAIAVYNSTTLLADDEYNDQVDLLEEAISNLVISVVDASTLSELSTLYNNNYSIYKNPTLYDTSGYSDVKDAFEYVAKILNSEDDIQVREADGSLTATYVDGDSIAKSVVVDAIEYLQSMIDYAATIKLDRTALADLIEEAESIVDDTSYDETEREKLQSLIDEAETYADEDNYTTQDDIDDAYEALYTQYEATLNTKMSTLITSTLNTLLSTAQELLTETEDYTDDTMSALSTAYTAGQSALSSATTQDEIDSAASALQTAIDNFYIYKPSNSSDLYDEDIVRVWIDGTYLLTSGASASENGLTATFTTGSDVAVATISLDTATGYYYIDFDSSKYSDSTLQLVLSDSSDTYYSSQFTISGQNTILVLTAASDGTLEVTKSAMVTLYIPAVTGVSTYEISVAGVSAKVSTTTASNYSSYKYYYARFAYTSGDKITVNTDSEYTLTLDAGGEYIYDTSSGTTYDVSEIYPKSSSSSTTTSTTTTTASASTATASNLVFASSTGSVSLLTSSDLLYSTLGGSDGYSITTVSKTTVSVTSKITEDLTGKTLIWFDAGKSYSSAQTVTLYAWKSSGSNNASWPGISMIAYGDDDNRYYYYILDSSYPYVIVVLNGIQSADLTLATDSSGNIYQYQTITISGSATNSYWTPTITGSSSAPTVTETSVSGDLTDYETATMAFVGGQYYQLTNYSYAMTFTSGSGGTVYDYSGSSLSSSSNPFGGYWSGSYGSSTMNRVGDTLATVMYDWYSYKIAIDAETTYSIQFSGLYGDDTSLKTDSIQDIWGDSWFVLNSATTGTTDSGKRLTDYSIYSFDPSDSSITSEVTIYINVPTDETWENIQVTGYGVETTTTSFAYDSDASTYTGCTYYSATISSTSPYLIISATVDGEYVEYKTSLQGGDYILFDPTYNLGSGGWDTFVTPATLLSREVVLSISTYYGSCLTDSYDENGYVDGSYYKPLAFYTYLSGYLNSANEFDESIIDGLSWSAIYSMYETLHEARTTVESLYSLMATARSYISGYNFPEYINRGTLATYDIGTLETKYWAAWNVYSSSSSSLSDFETQISILKTAISNITIDSQNSAIAIFYDVLGIASSSTINIYYTIDNGSVVYSATVTDVNTEGFPIYFISLSSGQTATDVYFEITTAGTVRTTTTQDIEIDKAYVWMDYSGTAYWKENATMGFVEFSTDAFTQESSSDTYYVAWDDDDSGYMALYFYYDTTVTYSGGSYIIYAGQYTFMTDSSSSTGFAGSYGDEAPFYSDGSGGYRMNLFSSEAEDYFTNALNYGEFVSGTKDESGSSVSSSQIKSGSTLGWVSDSTLSSGAKAAVDYYANLSVSECSFNGTYGSTKGIYFRWCGNTDITISKSFTLQAPIVRLAFSGTVTASNYTTAHFYLQTSNLTEDYMYVTFISDVTISYTDSLGDDHTFTIHAGEYKITRDESSTASTGIIADLFDEDYWNSSYVALTSSYTNSSSGSSGTLSNAVYS